MNFRSLLCRYNLFMISLFLSYVMLINSLPVSDIAEGSQSVNQYSNDNGNGNNGPQNENFDSKNYEGSINRDSNINGQQNDDNNDDEFNDPEDNLIFVTVEDIWGIGFFS
ncbi:hypothetical protein G9A89_002350 [Geosiphon pyriformis]|nr:hypothetical protein G9A89_002350 [Geosiphon pyriformis]